MLDRLSTCVEFEGMSVAEDVRRRNDGSWVLWVTSLAFVVLFRDGLASVRAHLCRGSLLFPTVDLDGLAHVECVTREVIIGEL